MEASATDTTFIQWYDADNLTNATLLGEENTLAVTEAGTYYAVALNLLNDDCFSEFVAFEVANFENPIADFSLSADTICLFDEINVTFVGTADSTATIEWTFENANQNNATGNEISGISWTAAGTYEITVLVTEENGCSDSFTQSITVSSLDVEISPNVSNVSVGTVIDLTANASSTTNSNLTYTWSSVADLDCYDCETTSTTVTENSTYQVVVSDEYACTASAEALVTTFLVNEIAIPNAFCKKA